MGNLQFDAATLARVDHVTILQTVDHAAVIEGLLLFILRKPALHRQFPESLDLGARELTELLEAVLCVRDTILFVDVLVEGPDAHYLHPGSVHSQLVHSLEVEN